ncbi:bifunctional nuclease family protein [Pelagicoccus sp. SDUM812003]|uniref:bifunctional nuclease family protein n=1 Tax=Pelagicoccus sp. SDUM812003 TaxID=3041267 RepID=UPI00280D7E85|nr:bifunctional nuclease family protein [Pelagicoccus sp. SDUM812003]MDQ8202894.1 bifunctional nuclease family protein [Pelagicoccus sp. SDUM812003]
MNTSVIQVSVKGVMPTVNGCAVFLGNDDKVFVIYVDHSVGNAISMALNGVKKERPLTHDLISAMLLGLEAKITRIIINDVQESTFFARIFLEMSNEVDTKIIELDARPSDSIVLSLQNKVPIYVAEKVFNSTEDMSSILERVLKQQNEENEG